MASLFSNGDMAALMRYGRQPRVVPVLLGLNIALFALQALGAHQWLVSVFGLWPDTVIHHVQGNVILWSEPSHFRVWQLFSYAFLHGNLSHLLLNMLGVFMFGSAVERAWGAKRFLVYYLVCILGAAYAQLWVTRDDTAHFATIGASGGLFGLLMAFGVMFPNHKLVFLFFPYPIAAKYFVVIYGLVELSLGIANLQTGVAHFAHLGGMITGLILLLYWTNKLPVKPLPGKLF